MPSDPPLGDPPDADAAAVGRRGFAQTLGKAGLVALTGTASATPAAGQGVSTPIHVSAWPGLLQRRRLQAFAVRRDAALAHLRAGIVLPSPNGDDWRYADRRASFFKGLPQNELGEVDPAAYASLLSALASGGSEAFAAVPLAPTAVRRLVNPQAAYAFELVGIDSHATELPAPPRFASALAAAEVGEIYWMALCRDVPFRAWADSPLMAAAVADLNRFSRTVGPLVDGAVTTATLFRGEAAGDLSGPYLSQFLWQDVPYGPTRLVQRYPIAWPGIDFMTRFDEWLAIQRGSAPAATLQLAAPGRYIFDLRALALYVRSDFSFQAFLNAALILLGQGAQALDPANPYRRSPNQEGFVTFGAADVLDLVTKAARLALEGAWYHKWLVHRRLRPEVMGARIALQLAGVKAYGIDHEILASDAVARLLASQGHALLPQAYPEGSPLHPAYPSGHAVVAGACATVLKAFFNEEFVLDQAVQANGDGSTLEVWTGPPLRVGPELDKLASNLGVGRCAAGIHYRFDNRGLAVGEQQAIGLLRDYSRTYTETFAGFTLRMFDGTQIRIVGGNVIQER